MTNAVISAVESMAEKEGQPLIKGGVSLFEWRPNAPVEDTLEENVTSTDDPVFIIEDVFEIQGDDADADLSDNVENGPDDDVFEDAPDDNPVDGDDLAETDDPAGFEPDGFEPGADDKNGTISGVEDDFDRDRRSAEPEANENPNANRYNLRSDRGRTYDYRLDHQMDDPENSKSYESGVQMLQQAADSMHETPNNIYKYICRHIMTQMTATAGIKKHGQVAVDALLQEFCRLDNKGVFDPINASTLTTDQKQEALRAVNPIKEKRSGKLKGRTCADGRSQRAHYTKEDTTSPTLSTDALMLSLMIDAKEGRDVATADVKAAYYYANMEDFVILKLAVEAVDIMCQVNSKYKKFVVVEHGKKVLYLQLPCTDAFSPLYYGTSCSPFLWLTWVLN